MTIYPAPGGQSPYISEDTPPPPPQPEPAPRRIPHLGHALLFVVTAAALLFGALILLTILGKPPVTVRQGVATVQHPFLQMAVQAAIYIFTLLIAALIFPAVWNRPFLEGIRWNWYTARVQAPRLVSLGLLLGIMMQIVTYFTTPPK